jgi:hypothetical protein
MLEKHRQPIDTPPPMSVFLPGPEDLAALSAAYSMTADGYRDAGMPVESFAFREISELLGNLGNRNPNLSQPGPS